MNKVGIFHFCDFAFAVPLEQIKKILQNAKQYNLPCLPSVASCVLVDDNSLVPLFDSVNVYGVNSSQFEVDSGYQVLVSTEYGVVALPANLAGKIVATSKGEILELTADTDVFGAVGKFLYDNDEYNILDINYLAIEMTHGIWHNQPDTGGARRHQ